jgi:hypothetical protein
MHNKQTELKIQKQIEYVDDLIQELSSDGHAMDIDTIDILDELARLGLELTPVRNENIPSLAYIHLMSKIAKQGDN